MLQLRARAATQTSSTVGQLAGRPCIITRLSADAPGGGLRTADGLGLASAAEAALAARIPLVCFFTSSGAAISDGVDAVVAWGGAARALAACSGVVPTVMVVDGPAVSGSALLLGVVDHVVMTDRSYAFVSGPAMVQQYTGVPMDNISLGGTAQHSRSSGLTSFVVDSADAGEDIATELLALLPSSTDETPPRWPADDPVDRPCPELESVVPASPTGSYDVRTVLRSVVDDGEILETRASWATNIVTAFATIAGYPVGLVANQPQSLAGTLDIHASQKGARFVAFCDAFNLPLVTFVDTPGFQPGKDLEWRGMIRHGAQLAFAYARATVPRVCITLRKSYGGAYIVMDSKHMGNDLAYAWPSAEIAVMGARGAVEILHRRSPPEDRPALEADYEERLLNPYIAAERGSIDGVIHPAETRQAVAGALDALATKRERLRARSHDNMPV